MEKEEFLEAQQEALDAVLDSNFEELEYRLELKLDIED
jgi:hypothetical protein